jgi:hypothetical protein
MESQLQVAEAIRTRLRQTNEKLERVLPLLTSVTRDMNDIGLIMI